MPKSRVLYPDPLRRRLAAPPRRMYSVAEKQAIGVAKHKNYETRQIYRPPPVTMKTYLANKQTELEKQLDTMEKQVADSKFNAVEKLHALSKLEDVKRALKKHELEQQRVQRAKKMSKSAYKKYVEKLEKERKDYQAVYGKPKEEDDDTELTDVFVHHPDENIFLQQIIGKTKIAWEFIKKRWYEKTPNEKIITELATILGVSLTVAAIVFHGAIAAHFSEITPETFKNAIKSLIALGVFTIKGLWNVIQGVFVKKPLKKYATKVIEQATDISDGNPFLSEDLELEKIDHEPREPVSQRELGEIIWALKYANNAYLYDPVDPEEEADKENPDFSDDVYAIDNGKIIAYYGKLEKPFLNEFKYVFAFRGTTDLTDIFVDLKAGTIKTFGAREFEPFIIDQPQITASEYFGQRVVAAIKGGLEYGIEHMLAEMASEMKRNSFPGKILVTGHSLGGAAATVFAVVLAEILKQFTLQIQATQPSMIPPNSELIKLITFEPARSLTREMVEEIKVHPHLKYLDETSLRVQNQLDPVPDLPPAKLGFRHLGVEVYIPATQVYGAWGESHSINNVDASLRRAMERPYIGDYGTVYKTYGRGKTRKVKKDKSKKRK